MNARPPPADEGHGVVWFFVQSRPHWAVKGWSKSWSACGCNIRARLLASEVPARPAEAAREGAYLRYAVGIKLRR